MATVLRPPFWAPRPGDEAYWQGAPGKSPIIAFLTKQKIFGAGGQVPPFRPNFTYDDPPMWQGAPAPAAAIPLLTHVKLFGQGGQAPPFRANFSYDDPPSWERFFGRPNLILLTTPIVEPPAGAIYAPRPPEDNIWQPFVSRNLGLYSPSQNPFSNRPVFWSDDAAVWQGAPIHAAAIPLLTQQKVFGQGGQVPPFRPNFTYDDPPVWQINPESLNSAALQLLTSVKFFGQGGQVPPFRPNFTYDDASYWAGEPINSAVLQLLTQQKIFGQGGQVPPFKANFTYDDSSFWQGQPAHAAAIPLLTSVKFYGQGGQVPAFRWNHTYDDPPVWQGAPTSAAAIPLLTAIKFFGQGGQVPTFTFRFGIDDPPTWQPFIWRNPTLYPPATNPFVPNFWQYNPDNPPQWQGTPTAAGLSLSTSVVLYPPTILWAYVHQDDSVWRASPTANFNLLTSTPATPAPFSNRQTWWTISDESQWLGAPQRSAAIPLLTQQKMFGAGGQVPTFTFRFGIDDPPTWQPFIWRNPTLYPPTPQNPFSNRPIFWSMLDDAAVWQGAPTAAAAIPLLTQVKFFGQGGQAPTFTFRFGLDDPPTWQPTAEHSRVIQILTAGGEPFAPAKWNQNFDDPPMWQGMPSASAAIPLLTFTKIFGQGGQVPAFRWNHTYDDASYWQGKPANAAAIPLLTAVKFFGQGGQAPPFRPNLTIDDPPMWQGAPVPPGLILITTKIVFPFNLYAPTFAWAVSYDDSPMWVGMPTASVFGLNVPKLATLRLRTLMGVGL